jgi:hypothetical protein
MNTMLSAALLLAIATAWAEEPAPGAAAPADAAKTRPPLKLRLEEAPAPAPRITFEPREHTSNPTPPDVLPALGGRPSPAFDQKTPPGTKGSPFPPDSNPSH